MKPLSPLTGGTEEEVVLLAPGQKLSLAGWCMERWSCCWSCCPRQKRGIKTAGFSLLPSSSLPPGLPLAIFSWKPDEVGAEKGSLRGSATANTEQSRGEWKTCLRANYPGEANHSSLSPSPLIKVRVLRHTPYY
ncbi:hypothetical protein HJG60_010934 [Phyllostomus discolor]|uniref:Uncharacterized protein n=1 Tax=Phyllostomus discolor TaxID=89673 RepID=A0A834AC69_9CHIR|nr:hypothetical protein HJG60_010934 [Phyllostomus discolor]